MTQNLRGYALVLSLGAPLLSGCGVGICIETCSSAQLTYDDASAIQFGVRGFGTTSLQTLTLRNQGKSDAQGLSSAVITAPFYFAGGAFPGSGGTCTDSLAAGSICTLTIAFVAPPPPEVSKTGTLAVPYSDGTISSVFEIPLSGSAGNGSFNRSRGLNSHVLAIAASSGRVVLGGEFVSNNSQAAGGVLFADATGSSAPIGTGFDYPVEALELANDGSGDVYVGGWFTSYNGSTNINRITRLNSDGSVDTSFNIGTGPTAGFDTGVYDIALAADGSGDIYVAGQFTAYRGTLAVTIARINSDGSLDSGFNVGFGFDANVNAVAVATDGSGDVYFGGFFTNLNGNADINRIVRLNSNGSIDAGFDIGTGGTAGFDGEVFALAVATDGSGDIYVGGTFNSYNGTGDINRIVRLNSNGSIDAGFNIGSGGLAGFDNTVYALAATPTDIYVGGIFTVYNSSTNTNRLVRLNSNGTIDSGFNVGTGASGGLNNGAYALRLANDGSSDVYVGGTFSQQYRGTAINPFILRLKEDGAMNSSFSLAPEGVIGFTFSNAVGAIAPAEDGSGDIYVAGGFTRHGGQTDINRIARLNSDGTLDTAFSLGSGATAGFNDTVTLIRIAADGTGNVYAAGLFTSYNGSTNINRIARLRPDGSLDPSFDIGSGASAGFNLSAGAIATARDGTGDIYVGGSFNSYRGTANIRAIARLNSNGSLDTGFNIGSGAGAGFNSAVYFLALAEDSSGDLYVGGNFTGYNGATNVNRLARLNSDGSLDTAFDIGSGPTAGFNSAVYAIAPARDGSGDVYFGGNFTTYNGTANINNIVRLNSNGTIDTGFDIGTGASAGFNATVLAFSLSDSGALYVGGGFTSFRGTTNVNRLTRLNPSGSIDTTFNIGSGASAGPNFEVVGLAGAVDGSGDLYACGSFSSFQKSETVFYFGRFSSTGELD